MKRAFVIGSPVAHSRSPALFAQFAAVTGIALEYAPLEVPPGELGPVLARLAADPAVVGANVTIPHKEDALALAISATPVARACGAANVLTHEGDGFAADNTDVPGIETALSQAGVELRGARVVIFGCGGAARAMAFAAVRGGAQSLAIAARNRPRAIRLAAQFDADVTGLDAPRLADLYVNATPVGMAGAEQRSLLPPAAPPDAAAFDLVYVPEETPFLADARARGMRTVTGTAMFLAQASATFERWFGVRPEAAVA